MSVDTAILIAKWLLLGQLALIVICGPVWMYSTWRYKKTQADLNRCQSMPVYKDQ